jgi:hypothetical protein
MRTSRAGYVPAAPRLTFPGLRDSEIDARWLITDTLRQQRTASTEREHRTSLTAPFESRPSGTYVYLPARVGLPCAPVWLPETHNRTAPRPSPCCGWSLGWRVGRMPPESREGAEPALSYAAGWSPHCVGRSSDLHELEAVQLSIRQPEEAWVPIDAGSVSRVQ